MKWKRAQWPYLGKQCFGPARAIYIRNAKTRRSALSKVTCSGGRYFREFFPRAVGIVMQNGSIHDWRSWNRGNYIDRLTVKWPLAYPIKLTNKKYMTMAQLF